MKKFTFYFLTVFTFLALCANSQNLVVNGDLESWTSGTPDNWDVAENISQETTTVHGGSSSAAHTSDQLTKDFRQEITGISGGTEYTISYWYYDNNPDARTRIWSYWTQGGANLPDNGDILRPSVYSEDNANWQEFSATLTAPAGADGFKFEVRVYQQDGNFGGSVFYDDFVFSGDVTVDPEPSNYPTSFSATVAGAGIELNWTDATGTQLPDAYIIMAGASPSLPVPVDGTPVTDDLDLSDGSGALNVAFGEEMASFTGLESNTTYYFSIYPYTNAGVNIDFKTDGTAPSANATTSSIVVIESENFDDSWGNWQTISVVGAEEWDRDNTYGINNTPCARMSGYNGSALDNEDWLISPALDMDEYDNENLIFFNASNYDGPDMECLISSNYSGSGDPNSATWTSLSYILSGGSWEWVESGNIDLSAYSGTNYIGFKYTSTTAGAATWEVDDITITGEGEVIIDPEPSNYPTAFDAIATGTTIDLSWTDATGTQLPDKYIVFAGTSASLPTPVDGIPTADDLDLSDGSGAVNVNFGEEMFAFSSLDPATTYYFSIFPYTNSGVNIDYKTDGTAPTANATTENIEEVTIEEENFDVSWGNWTTISVVGAEEWDRDNTFGINDTPCASMSGYNGAPFDNDDWLVSPAMNFDEYENEKIEFFNAMNYTGPDLEFKVSTDYDGGGDPYSANWTTLSFVMSGGGWDWVSSGEIDLSGFTGSSVYVAFHFTSTTAGSATWEIDDISITGEQEATIDPEPSNYPVDFSAIASATNIDLSWTDATGTQLPDAYIIFAGTDASLPMPVDGSPVLDDLDLSDGSGAVNVDFGDESFSFSSLAQSTTYYFVIYSYTNNGANIDYKTDGTAPEANATTGTNPYILYQNFDNGFENWETVSVVGEQEWDITTQYGYPDPPSARMSGYAGGAVENEDWLISPAFSLDDFENEILTFYNTKLYDGEDLFLHISNDYDGGGNPATATWTDIDFELSTGDWVSSGELDLSGFTGTSVYIAFKYTSSSTDAPLWEVDEILIDNGEVIPEPTNYPTAFEATANGTTIALAWEDATGTQLPESYLIMAGINASLPIPADGSPVADDIDLSDGSGTLNIAYGVEQASFSGLDPATTYYFTIYPYTNTGSGIDYKNDGTAPSANATTANVEIVTIEEENFDDSWGNWTPISVVGAEEWDRDNTYGINFTPCAQMSGYNGQAFENDDWLISPSMNFEDYENVKIVFFNAMNYTGPDMELKVSTDYDGGGDPYSANWTSVTYTMSGGGFEWVSSGDVDLSGFSGSSVYVAFQFTSTTSGSATWEVDEIVITGEQEGTINPEPTNYPTNFTAGAAGTNIILSWNDATGAQLPDAYIIFAGTNASLPIAEDGTPVADDLDLSDGSGAINVDYGQEEYTFSNLDQNITLYFTIYPYTNSGVNIDYKNDGTAPASNATTGANPFILYQGFDNGFGDWETVSVIGAQTWQIDNDYGFPDPPSARMSGYSGGSVDNEDWLISPAMDLSNTDNEILTFYNAQNFDTPPLELKISTDYDGGGNPSSASWTNISFNLSPGFYEWTESGEIDLSGYNEEVVYIAFVYYSNTSASAVWEVDEILVEDGTLLPEPTNYPTNLTAETAGSSISVSFTDATGTQIPEGYVLYGSTSPTLPVPADGTPVANDTDLSDGTASADLNYGVGEITFGSLPPNTTYYFTIYPYTNNGEEIDYKTGGTPPATSATTENVVLSVIEYQNFDDSWGGWQIVSVVGDEEWSRDNTYGIDFTPCAQMSGYNGSALENDDWMISPPLDLEDFQNVRLNFQNAMNYTGPDMQLKVSTDYNGGGDPYAATWTSLNYTMSSGGFTWTSSGDIDLSQFTGGTTYVAFQFTSTTSGSATWEVDEVMIEGEEEYVVKPEPTNYPQEFGATNLGLSIQTIWQEAAGIQDPDGYLIMANKTGEFDVPVDGVPVQTDSDLSDGVAAVIVAEGLESFVFENGLTPYTMYYFVIYPFTNVGTDINYKNDGSAPVANAHTTQIQQIVLEEQNFDFGWGDWTIISEVGDNQEWEIDTYGYPTAPCAAITGFDYGSSSSFDNSDWLISPAFDLNSYPGLKVSFYNAKDYTGPDMELKVSTNYDGGDDPSSADWTSMPFNISGGDFIWTSSGNISLNGFSGDQMHIAFHYTSTTSQSANWEVDHIKVIYEEVLGMNENIFNNANVAIYPNPANQVVNILQKEEVFNTLEVRNTAGNIVKQQKIDGVQTSVNISHLTAGLYILLLQDSETGVTATRKLIIK